MNDRVTPDWRCAPFRTRRSPRRCAIAADARSQSRVATPIRGSRGLRRMACSWSGITSSIDPVNELAPAETRICALPSCDRARAPSRIREWPPRIGACARRTWPLAKCASGLARRCRQGLSDQPFRACNVRRQRSRSFRSSTRPAMRICQPALCLDGSRIERQCALEQADRLAIGVTRLAASTLPRVPGECSRAHRDRRSAERPPRRSSSRSSAIAIRLVISFCRANRSLVSPSNRSAHRCASVSASISWALTRTWLPDRRTLPSST